MKEKIERNEQIRQEYHKGLGTILGNKHGITRQMIHEIVHRPHQKSCGGQQRSWLLRWMDWFPKIIKGGQ